jgi:uncharacterized protein (TIGR00288 family)
MASQNDVTNMALFCDFENVALGVADARYDKFDIKRVLEKLLLKGSIVVKKAYCDWDRYKAHKRTMHEANFELIEIPHVRISGKNSADIRMVVDALDLCYTKSHVDTFVIISGDSDFSPLVSKLRENAKTVIGVGVKNSTSDLLIANCDEFIYYDDLVREQRKAPARRTAKTAPKAAEPEVAAPAAVEEAPAAPATGTRRRNAKSTKTAAATKATKTAKAAKGTKATKDPEAAKGADDKAAPARGRKRSAKKTAAGEAGASAAEAPPEGAAATPVKRSDDERLGEALDLIVNTVDALAAERGGDDKVWGSMVKQAIKRVKPGFNESYYGFRSFNALLEEAQARGLVALERDEKSGGYALRIPASQE